MLIHIQTRGVSSTSHGVTSPSCRVYRWIRILDANVEPHSWVMVMRKCGGARGLEEMEVSNRGWDGMMGIVRGLMIDEMMPIEVFHLAMSKWKSPLIRNWRLLTFAPAKFGASRMGLRHVSSFQD